MIDLDDILKNDTVKDLLKKAGVPEDKAESVAKQAAGSIKAKYDKDPSQMASLMSKNKNTDKDEVLKKEVEDDFLDGLIKKVGLPEGIADQVKGALPGIMEQVSSKFTSGESGGGIMDTVTDMIGGDDKKSGDSKSSSKGGGMFGFISKFLKK